MTENVYDTNRTPVGPWRKASASNGTGGCIELAPTAEGGVLLRDSKDNGNGPIQYFTRHEFAAFLDGCNAGEFNDLVS